MATTSKNKAVFGIYPSVGQAERAVDTLLRAGFANGAISVLLPDDQSTRDFAHKKDTKAPRPSQPLRPLVPNVGATTSSSSS